MKSSHIFFPSAVILVLSFIYGIDRLLESHELDQFCILTPERLHALSLNSIQQHGNDTRALVTNIVDQLRSDVSVAPYLSVDEEWVFNNAGGAMGAM